MASVAELEETSFAEIDKVDNPFREAPEQDLLLVLSERGELALVRATAERFEEVARIQALDGKTWNHPIVVDGVVYLRNAQEAAAYRLPV